MFVYFFRPVDIYIVIDAQIRDMKRKTLAMLFASLFSLAAVIALEVPALQRAGARTEGENREIFLTFDDGPTDSTTPLVLDVLKKENVRATFFVIGRQIAGREEIVRRTAHEGHAIGIHSQTHEYKEIYASPEALLADIEACRKAILSVLPNFSGKLYRYPGGSISAGEALRSAVKGAGWEAHDWNASVEDAVQRRANADELYRNAVSTAAGKNRVVLLLHDGVNYKQTVLALPQIIRYFKGEGYVFKTL